MALTREAVVGAAVGILREFGLADLSMRRLARDLNVQVGALYWHVSNKQELLVEVAAELLSSPALTAGTAARPPAAAATWRGDILHLGSSLHTLLLPVPDSAEVVQVARVLAPERLAPLTRMTETFTAAGLTPERAASAQSLVVNHVLGAVAEAQNRADFEITGSATDYRWALERALDGLLPPVAHDAGNGRAAGE
ncbi:TetR/AcrR family transcriptional regulator C-terminal domain-containing protein [Zhihengliuella flava]|uniref:AcrR family transcriptional regulator n=1 Tax=Zhihengliuella flava TaxID=1285193 RepID=A0A931DDT0_9MICC|nr:TetR/AcrR family transcriptional regulator C-terminal domain-containing protein [Zhihengliuella flava]MBG6084945.1 AcrR family transcriptional regulator [Zhihengliuella flava]